jgi:ketosteroid isomerase-like protein
MSSILRLRNEPFYLYSLAMIKIFAALLLLTPLASSPQTADTGLRKILDDQTTAWNGSDLVGFMQGYWHSPEVTFFSGDTIIRGWESTLQRYRNKYQGDGKEMGKLSFTDEKTQMLGSDSALVTARWHLEMPDGKRLEGLTTLLCKRLPEGWRIVHDHSS